MSNLDRRQLLRTLTATATVGLAGCSEFQETLEGVEALGGGKKGTFDPTTATEHKLVAANGTPGAIFGWSVAIWGETAFVGAPMHDGTGGTNSGLVYVFERSEAGWSQSETISAPDPAPSGRFGLSVAASEDTALVGDPYTDQNGTSSGTVSVFEREGGGWRHGGTLAPSDGADNDRFGIQVDVDGSTAVVGASGQDEPNGSSSGSAYVFERDSDGWDQTAKLVAEDGDSADSFSTPAISGDVIVVGAYNDEDPYGTGGGSAYVFERDGGVWSQSAKLTAPNGRQNYAFGVRVAVAGDTLLVGAARAQNQNGVATGAVYAFERGDSGWAHEGTLTASDGDEGDRFANVGLDGNVAIVGAMFDEDPNGTQSGSSYVFRREDGEWTQLAKLTPSDGDADDQFGSAVAIDGRTVLVGAPRDENTDGSESGSAYLFDS